MVAAQVILHANLPSGGRPLHKPWPDQGIFRSVVPKADPHEKQAPTNSFVALYETQYCVPDMECISNDLASLFLWKQDMLHTSDHIYIWSILPIYIPTVVMISIAVYAAQTTVCMQLSTTAHGSFQTTGNVTHGVSGFPLWHPQAMVDDCQTTILITTIHPMYTRYIRYYIMPHQYQIRYLPFHNLYWCKYADDNWILHRPTYMYFLK